MLVIVVAILGFIAVAGLGLVFAGAGQSNARTTKRTQAIAERGRPEAKLRARSAATDPTQRRKQIVRTLKDQEKQQRKASLTLSARLQQAGLNNNVKGFWIASAVVGVVAAILVTLFMRQPLIGLGAGFVAGAGLPRWVIGFMAQSRSKKFSEAFADATDIIVRGIKSGLPVHDCLKIIGRECPEPLAGEFRNLVENISMGVPIEQALEKMYARMPTAELRFFTIVLTIQQKTGGNLAEALSNLSAVLRSRKLMREKIKALSSEATASAMIIGCLPPSVVLLITVTSPNYMAIMFSDNRGHFLLLISATLMGFGIWVMRRMINFKF